MKPCCERHFAILLIFLAASAQTAFSQIDAPQFERDLKALTATEGRLIGSAGYQKAAAYIEAQARAIPNAEFRTHDFAVSVPVTESATLNFQGGTERIYPFWPAHVRACSTPADGITGNLVYLGRCRPEDLRPASIRGQIAVVEAAAQDRWVTAFNAGARAAIILGAKDTTWQDLRSHDLRVPANLPRFYVPPGPLADRLRRGEIASATLKSTVNWQQKTARNIYVLVRAKEPAARPVNEIMPPAAMMFSAPFDSSSLVPELAPGASQAVQAAGALALLRDAAKAPANRPVVFFFSGADSIQFLGTRNMFLALAEPPSASADELSELDEKLAITQKSLDEAQRLAREWGGGQKKLAASRELVARMLKLIETDRALEQDRLYRLRARSFEQSPPDTKAELQKLESRQVLLGRLMFAVEQDPKSLDDPALRDEARAYLERTIAQLAGDTGSPGLITQYQARKEELATRGDLYRWLAERESRPSAPARNQTDGRLIEVLVGLDLSDRGSRCGPMYYGTFQRNSGMPLLQEFRDWFMRLRSDHENHSPAAKWFDPVAKVISLEPLTQSNLPPTYLAAPLPLPSELSPAWGTPGLSMITLDDLRLWRDTPNDTLDRLNTAPIIAQLEGICDLFTRAWADPKFRGPTDLRRAGVSFIGQVVSPSAAKPVPDLPRPGFLVSYYYSANKDKKQPQLGALPWVLGIRRNEIRACDAEGNYRFEGLPKLRNDRLEGTEKQQADLQLMAVHAYRLDARTGEITATTDLGKQAGDLKWSVDLKEPVQPLRSLVFNCEEFTLTELYDPRYLQGLGEVTLLDARRGTEPQRYDLLLADQILAGFAEPGTPLQLLIRYGRVGNRLVLLNMTHRAGAPTTGDASPSALKPIGFTPRQIDALGPLALATSRDFYRLDDLRLNDYRRAGVSASFVDALHTDAEKQIAQAEQAVAANDGVSLLRNATGAWANEVRVYNTAQDLARDVVRAAIFLLLLCAPFSFCMERLLIASTSVYRQIAGMFTIFVIMLLVLWSFHPAFRISSSPLIIVLAFAIILMSCVVIGVVYGKFDTEIKRIRSGTGAAGTALVGGGVLVAAMLLGIANMRRRRFRTALTSITVALITFAVLCFTSTKHYIGTTTESTGIAATHPGVLMRQRGYRPMPAVLPDQLRAVLADPALKVNAPAVVENWWAVSTLEPNERYNLISHFQDQNEIPKTATIPAVLGVSAGESKLSRIAEVLGPDAFARLENGEDAVIYLPAPLAETLAVKPGNTIRIAGIALTVASVFDPAAFDQKVRTLNGESLAPLRYVAGQLDAGGRRLDDTASESLNLDSGATDSGSYEHLSASEFAIVSASTCRKLYKASLRSVALRLDDAEQVKRVSNELSLRFSLPIFAGLDDGVRMVAANQIASVSGGAQAAIPLIIGGLIIFNTMMGSVAERRRDIHVYTSLGLAPFHVGALFMAEAIVYGLIGSVFGYVAGQGTASLLLKLGMLGPATLNYSGTSAVMTMGLILAIVIVSALIPARTAAKVAAPSVDRDWKVPASENDQISAVLPFTINRMAADGALAYLADYLRMHRDGNIGKFAADAIETVHSSASDSTRTLKGTIWLTPFDLGVRQELSLLIYPSQAQDIFEVKVELKRLSGDEQSWHRMNRLFLGELRKQFLSWRSLTPARMLEYVERSRRSLVAQS